MYIMFSYLLFMISLLFTVKIKETKTFRATHSSIEAVCHAWGIVQQECWAKYDNILQEITTVLLSLRTKAAIHQVTTMLATSKKSHFQVITAC